MLQQLFHILILSIVCIVWGIPVLLIFNSSIKKDKFWYHSFAGLLCLLFFCGCIFISIISAWLYLFAPLKFYYLALLTTALLLYLFLFQKGKIFNLFSEAGLAEDQLIHPACSVLFCKCLFICFIECPATRKW